VLTSALECLQKSPLQRCCELGPEFVSVCSYISWGAAESPYFKPSFSIDVSLHVISGRASGTIVRSGQQVLVGLSSFEASLLWTALQGQAESGWCQINRPEIQLAELMC
jgi:hypothetical protein